MTDAVARGVLVLRQFEGEIGARDFARAMWPDSPSWHRHGKCGPNGVALGIGIQQRAGSFLRKLCDAGLAHIRYTENGMALYQISRKGSDAAP